MTAGRPSDVPLTEEEKRAIASLKRLAEKWPKSLWLFSASGTLCVMRCDSEGKRAVGDRFGRGDLVPVGRVDPNYRMVDARHPVGGGLIGSFHYED